MAILEKEVWMKCGLASDKYYVEIGYKIPRVKDKKGIFKVKKGTKILVKVLDLPMNSCMLVTKVCDICGVHIKNQPYQAIIKSRNQSDGKDRCRKCGRSRAVIARYANVKYENSLEYFAIENSKRYLLKEYSYKNKYKANEISKGSNLKAIWNCQLCKNEYNMEISNKTVLNYGCPYCSGYRVNETNCLWTTHPEIAKLLFDKSEGFRVTHGSDKKLKFLCEECNHVSDKAINKVKKYGFSCSNCSDGISYPEKFMSNLLRQLNIDFEVQKTFDWSKNKRYDFYIKSLNLIIETHGVQHYKESLRGRTLKEEQENDLFKKTIAESKLSLNYIEIDCRISSVEYIKNNIMRSKLSVLIDFSKINWLNCHEWACSSLVKKSCDMWNLGIPIKEIACQLKINSTTVRKYLKQGNILNWCKYDVISIKKESAKNAYTKHQRKIIQLDNNFTCLKEWNSISLAQNELAVGNISNVCNGKGKTAGGYKWMYKEDYDKMIAETVDQ